jgi:Ca2+-binding EF-hand superfamily protein
MPLNAGENEGLDGLIHVVGKEVKKLVPKFSFDVLDADGDGKITKEEYSKGFDLIDQDKDGFITEVEFKSVSSCWIVTVKLLDKDGDGKISRSEWDAGFALFDRDGDGKINQSEWYIVSGSGFVFEMLDSDGDGRLTRLEYNMGFDILDKDQDGFLTRSEFGIASNLYFDELDEDGDGRLSREEFNGGFVRIDTDRDGFISRTEFTEFIQLPPPEEEESEERADRRYALLDRDDPRVAEIDALVAELNEQHAKTGIPAYPTWKEDAKEAERIFLETPDELPAWLKRMRIKNLSKREKRQRVLQLAAQLVTDDIIAIPPQQWRYDVEEASAVQVETKTPEEDRSAEAPPAPRQELTEEEAAVHAESAMMRRLGFIFIAYRVEYWWWEGMEMLRKFMMTWFVTLFHPSFPTALSLPSCSTSAPLLLPCLCVSLIVLGSSQLAYCVLL